MSILKPKEKPKETKTGRLETMDARPVNIELTKQQQLDHLTYLSLAALDIGLETGFKDGPMRDKGGALSVTAQRIGAVKEDGKTPIMKQEDAIYEVNYEAQTRANRRGKGQMEQKMRTLMSSIMAGKAPSPDSRKNYFSFGKGKSTEEAIALAKQAKAILEAAGFEVLHKPGTRGIHIVGFAKGAGSTVASLQKYVRKKAMEEVAIIRREQKSEEQLEREQLMAKRKEVTDELMKQEGEGYVQRPDADFDKMFSPDELAKLSAEDASVRIIKIILDPMIDDMRRDTLTYLLGRKDVVETLRTYRPFVFFTDREYNSYLSFLRGERKGAVAMRTPGRDYLGDLRARQMKEGSGPVPPWNAVMENAHRLMDGKKAVFIRSSYSSAAQTIAQLEQMYPGRSISWERSPESVLEGGGHWTITVEARGKKVPTNMQWLRANFMKQINQQVAAKDSRFNQAVGKALNGGTSTVEFTAESLPRWMSGMIDMKRTKSNYLVLKEEYWAKLQSKGIAVQKVIRGTPVYASERDKKKGNVQYYTFKLTFSGEKFSRQMGIARANAKRKYGKAQESAYEIARKAGEKKPKQT